MGQHTPKIIKPSGSRSLITDLRQPATDAFVNTVSGQGTKADKDIYNRFVGEAPITVEEIDAMYLNEWLSAKVVDALPHDMIRSWRKIEGLSAEEGKAFEEAQAFFEVKEKLEEGKKWSRMYGGAGAVLGVADGKQPNQELDVDNIKQGSLQYIHVIDSNKLRIEELEDNPLSVNYGKPRFYTIEQTIIHPSRVIPFFGTKVPRAQRHAFRNWGASIYQKMRAAIGRVNVAYGAGSAMLHEASLDIISIQGLFNMIGDCDGEGKIMQRMTLSQLTKSNFNMLMKDTEEEFTKITQNFAGIPDMIREMVIAISGAAEIPVTRLLGISPSGLNATGQADLTNYYDSVKAKQVLELGPKLKLLDNILMQHTFGRVIPDFKSEFNELWTPNKTEASEILEKTISSHEKAIGFVPLEVILKNIQAEGTYQISDEQITKALADYAERQQQEKERTLQSEKASEQNI